MDSDEKALSVGKIDYHYKDESDKNFKFKGV
jgi:hypothetical protein